MKPLVKVRRENFGEHEHSHTEIERHGDQIVVLQSRISDKG